MVAQTRTLEFGYITEPTRYNNVLFPVKNGRSLLAVMRTTSPKTGPPEEETFIDEGAAVDELAAEQDQTGEGIIDVISAGAKALSGIIPGAETVAGLAGTAGKVKAAFNIAKKTGKLVNELAFGKVGTTISNKLSEKFNKNPAWRPGFPGEAHVVLNTPFGLTRANFCGPGTDIIKRVNRGDRGVNQIDNACEKHDLLYHFAKTPEDLRRADNEMIREVDNVTDAGAVQKALAKGVIQAKKLGEDVGVFGPETFTSLPGLEGSGHRGVDNIITDRMDGVQRHMGQILTRVMNLPPQSVQSRFGGNGITRGHMISGNDTMRHPMNGQGIRKTGLLGNVKGRDPTISGMNTSFISGTGNNALVSILRNRGPTSLMGRGLLPQETRDSTTKKFLDPTIRNDISSGGVVGIGGNAFNLDRSSDNPNSGMQTQKGLGADHTANPRGSGQSFSGKGIIDDIGVAAANLPGNVLKKNVLKSIRKAQRKKKRVSGTGLTIAGGGLPTRANQKGGVLGILAGLAASLIIPEVIKLFKGKGGRGSSGKGIFQDLRRSIIDPILSLSSKKSVRDSVKKRKQKGKGKGRMVYPIHKKTFYPYELRKISSGASGQGKKAVNRPGAKLISKLAKKHGSLPMSLSSNALIPLMQAAAKNRKDGIFSGGRKQDMSKLARLAASLILPKLLSRRS